MGAVIKADGVSNMNFYYAFTFILSYSFVTIMVGLVANFSCSVVVG